MNRLGRAGPQHSGELNSLCAVTDAPLPKVGSAARLVLHTFPQDRPRTLIQSLQRTGFCAALGVGDRAVSPLISGGCDTTHPMGGRSLEISLGRELGGDTAQDCTNWLKTSRGMALRHAHQHARSRRHEVGKDRQGYGDV